MKRIIIPILVMILICSASVVLAGQVEELDLDFKGNTNQAIIYSSDLEEWRTVTSFDLELSRDFGFDKSIFINPSLEYEYSFKDDEGDILAGLDEGYFDLYLKDADIRIGKQEVNWGSGYKLNPTDKVNPMNLTVEDPIEAEIGVWALKGKYYYDYNTSLSGVAVADFEPALLPEGVITTKKSNLKSNFKGNLKDKAGQQIEAIIREKLKGYPEPIINKAIEEAKEEKFAAIDQSIKENLSFATIEPEVDGLDKAEYAMKFTRRDLLGYDLSISLFCGYEDLPSLKSDLSKVGDKILDNKEATIEFGYKRTNTVGIDAIGSIKNIGVWAETAYSQNEDKEKTMEAVIGGDYTFKNNLYTVVQAYHRNYHDYQIEQEDLNYLMVYNRLPIQQIHQCTSTAIYDLDNQEYLINPELKISLKNNLALDVGTVIMSDLEDVGQDALIKMLGEKKSYLNLTYNF